MTSSLAVAVVSQKSQTGGVRKASKQVRNSTINDSFSQLLSDLYTQFAGLLKDEKKDEHTENVSSYNTKPFTHSLSTLALRAAASELFFVLPMEMEKSLAKFPSS